MKLERFGPLANQIINRLASADRHHVVLDRPAVERAFAEHFRLLGMAPLPLCWMDDGEIAYDEIAQRFWATEPETGSEAARAEYDVYKCVFLHRGPSREQEFLDRIQASKLAVLSRERMDARAAMHEEATQAYQKAIWKLAWPDFKSLRWGSPSPSEQWKTAFLGSWSFAEEAAREAAYRRGRNRQGMESASEEVESAAWLALEAAYWAAARALADGESPAVEHYIAAHLPFLQAYEAGLWCFWVCRDEVVAVPRPSIRIHDNQLHHEDVPAVSWPNGTEYYFWHGIPVPSEVVESPQSLTVACIDAETNSEVRRVMIERFGQESYLIEGGAVKVDQTDWGTLYRRPIAGEEDLVMVKVINATAEPNGTFKDYFLRVPPHIQTAKEAVAWTFQESTDDYLPVVQT